METGGERSCESLTIDPNVALEPGNPKPECVLMTESKPEIQLENQPYPAKLTEIVKQDDETKACSEIQSDEVLKNENSTGVQLDTKADENMDSDAAGALVNGRSTEAKEDERKEFFSSNQHEQSEGSTPREQTKQEGLTTTEQNIHGASIPTQSTLDAGIPAEKDTNRDLTATTEGIHETSIPREQDNHNDSNLLDHNTRDVSLLTERGKHDVSTPTERDKHETFTPAEQDTHELSTSTNLDKHGISSPSQQDTHEISTPQSMEACQDVVKDVSCNVNREGAAERRESHQPTEGADNAVIDEVQKKSLGNTNAGDCSMADLDHERVKVHCNKAEEQNVGNKDLEMIEKSDSMLSDSVDRVSEVEMKDRKRSGNPIERSGQGEVTEKTQHTDDSGSPDVVLEQHVGERIEVVPAETQVPSLDESCKGEELECGNEDVHQEARGTSKSQSQSEVGSSDPSYRHTVTELISEEASTIVDNDDYKVGETMEQNEEDSSKTHAVHRDLPMNTDSNVISMDTNPFNIEHGMFTDLPVQKHEEDIGVIKSDDTVFQNNAVECNHDNEVYEMDEKKEGIEIEHQVPQSSQMHSENSPGKPENDEATGSPGQNVGTDIEMQEDNAIDATLCQGESAIQGMDLDGEEKTGNSDETNAGTSEDEKDAKTGLEKEETALNAIQKRRLSDDVASDSGGANSQGPADNVVKKSKKKTVNVWAKSSSRKGGKRSSKNGQQQNPNKEDTVMLTPVYVNPDKIEDGPDQQIVLSKYDKAEKIELSENRLIAGSTKGYRMVRATRGVQEGAWYFEIVVEHLGPTGHTRLGWSTQKGDVQAPVGFDSNSYAYRDIDGSKVHVAIREAYGEPYLEGDVIGFYINLPNGSEYAPKSAPIVSYRGRPYIADTKEEQPKKVPGSEICFFKNGVCQGTAFKDISAGRYFPAASMYTLPKEPNCTVRFNFGPEFRYPPNDLDDRPPPTAMFFAPYHNGLSSRDARPINNSSLANSTQNSEFQIR